MKRIYSFMVAAVAMIAAAACTQELENVEPEVNGESVVFTAYADGTDETKTALSGNKSLWKSGDRIWILNGKADNTGWKKGYSTEDNSATATFTEEDNSYALEGEQYFAVYPAAAADNATWEGGDVLGVTLKSVQDATAGSYDPAAHIAVATSTTTSLKFKNAVSLLKFTVKNEGVKSVTIYAREGGLLTGSCNISAEGNVTPWTGDGEANGWVELSAGEGTFAVGTEYYIAVFPNTDEANLTAGFTVQFSFGGAKYDVKSYTKALTLNRNEILDLGELEYTAAERTETVYLCPGVWTADGAWFAAYFFGTAGATAVTMTETAGVYSCDVPGDYENVIFCRMNPEYGDFGWDVWEGETETENHVWNQSADLNVPLAGDTEVYYNVTDWEAGEWSDTPQESTPDQPDVESSGWSLPGGYNSWNTTDTYLYEEGDYYVAKNVTVMKTVAGQTAGFKFQHAEFGWKGVGSTAPVAVGEWHKLNGESNISLPDAKAYDIYMTKDGSQFQAVVAGSAAPEAPVVVPDYWGLIGTMAGSAWGTDLVLTEEGEYLVYKGVTLTTSDEFKFHKNGEWNDQKIAKGGLAAANTEYDLVDSGQANMKVSTAGTYDIYVKKDISKVYFMETGKTPDQAVQPDLSNTYRFYVQNNVGWSTLFFYAWDGYKSADWPGDPMTSEATVDGYGTCKYIEITKGVSVVNFIVNDNSKQTKDLTVNNNSNVKTLANGDMIYILTNSDIK